MYHVLPIFLHERELFATESRQGGLLERNAALCSECLDQIGQEHERFAIPELFDDQLYLYCKR